MTQVCCKPGCNQPRMVSPSSGKPLTMCEAHQRAYWSEAKAKAESSNKEDKRPVGRPPAAVAKALQYLAEHPETAAIGSNRFSKLAHVSNTAALAALHRFRSEHPEYAPPIPSGVRPMQRTPLRTARSTDSAPVVPPPSNNAKRVKMLLIDESKGEVWQVTAVREHRIKPLKHPETIDVMKADGYAILYVRSEGNDE